MAKISFSSIISGARGKLAGVIFSANGSGPYIKPWAKSPTKYYSLQAPPRAFMSSHGSAWWGLTQLQRDNWGIWAALPAQKQINALGDDYYLSGWQWFVKLNQRLEQMQRTRISTYPATSLPLTPALTSSSLSLPAGGTLTINYASGEWTAYDLVIALSVRAGPGQAVGFLARAVTVLRKQAPINLTSETVTSIESFTGELYSGQRGFIWAYRQNTEGRRSAPALSYTDIP